MLRSLLGEASQNGGEPFHSVSGRMDLFVRLCLKLSEEHADRKRSALLRTYAVWAEGLRRSLIELEESLFAARYYGDRISRAAWEELTGEQKLDYDRHVYFDKNAFIRVFALLDKLGTLLNALLNLQTEKVKPRFSYFTVLRRMRESGRYPGLTASLTGPKEKHQHAMNRLRRRRNMEIHYMNAELKDDLNAGLPLALDEGEAWRLENIAANLSDLQEGWEMVLETLESAFAFACDRIRGMKTGKGGG